MFHDATSKLYHYTTIGGFNGIVNSRAIWATDRRFLNDYSEDSHGVAICERIHCQISSDSSSGFGLFGHHLHNVIELMRKTRVFVASFSSEQDILSQWRAYTGSSGVSIGFASHQLESLARHGCKLSRCIYRDEDKEAAVREFYGRLISTVHPEQLKQFAFPMQRLIPGDPAYIAAEVFVHELPQLLSTFKHEAFKEECEWRLTKVVRDMPHGIALDPPLMHRATGSQMVPYFELKFGSEPFIASVRVGPSSSKELQDLAVESIRQFTNESRMGLSSIARGAEVTTAAAPYRTGH